LIERDYGSKIRQPIEVVKFDLGNPSDHELTYKFWGDRLPQIVPEEVKELHVSLSGGVPALNNNLKEQAVHFYKAKCRLYQVISPSDEELRRGADLGTLQVVSPLPFLKEVTHSIVEQLTNRYDYSGALQV
jgi:hypothetical protein